MRGGGHGDDTRGEAAPRSEVIRSPPRTLAHEQLLRRLPLPIKQITSKAARRWRNDAELQGRPDEWGHTLLADHISTGDLGLSVDDDEYGLVMLDVGADICDVLASGTKNTTSVHHATKEFGSAVTWIYFFSDGAKELKKAPAPPILVRCHTAPSPTA